MMQKLKQKRVKARRDRVRPRIRGGVLVLAIATAFVMIGFASIISASMAVSVAGILLIASIAMFEKRRRSFWETSMHHKMRTVTQGHEKLERDVARNRMDIKRLKSGPAQNEKPKTTIKTMEERLSAHIENQNTKSPSFTPRAIKPAHLNQKPSKIKQANDEEAAYYKSLSDTVVTELMRHAIGSQDINVFVQPIMRLPQRKIRFFEMFARIRVKPGLYVPASRYLDLAKQENLLNDIDELLLMRCLEHLKKNGLRDDTLAYMLNISSATLKNVDFMSRLLAFISKNRALAPHLVFEMQQRDFENTPTALIQVLQGLGALGCNFSLDHVKSLNFDITRLTSMKVRFVKLSAKALIAKAHDEKGAAEIWRIKRKLESNGIGFIVEKIEDEQALRALLDFDIHYGQGYLFGKPDMRGAYKKSDAAKHIREAKRHSDRYSA